MITHFLVGIIIQKYLFGNIPFPFDVILIIILAFLSHIIIDSLARMVYHPPEPQRGDKIWLWFNVSMYLAGFIVLILFWDPYWLVMISAELFDIWDWWILRQIQRRIKEDFKWEKYSLHAISNKVRIKLFMWLPDLTYNHKGIIVEVFIVISLFIIILYL